MIIVGHRGAKALAPENTIASLVKGVSHGVDMLEFDVRVTSDHIPVLHHDACVTDPNGDNHDIAEYTYAELKKHKPNLALLSEVFTQISHNTAMYVEVKSVATITPIVAAIKDALRAGWPPEQLYIASKNQSILLQLHTALPDLQKIVIHPWSGVIATRYAKQVNTNFLAIDQRWLWSGFISSMTKRNWRIMAYTLNDPTKAYRWEQAGLYAVITDSPDRFEK